MATLEAFLLNSNKLEGAAKYYKCGQGFPIVLLHGFAETYKIWDPIFPKLSKKFQVIIPEIPSCGNSTSFKEDISMEQIAEFVNEILKQENINQIILFGHSMGGYASMAFAEKYAHKLKGLSLVHSSAQADSFEKKQIRKTAVNFINNNGKALFIKTLIPKLYASTSGLNDLVSKHTTMFMSYTDEQIVACYQAMMLRPDRTRILSKLDCPVQLIGGKEDASVNYKSIEKQSLLCKTGFLSIFEGVAHTSMHENPALLLECFLGFLDDILQTNFS